MECLLHFADISNSLKDKSISVEWAQRIVEEFRQQGDDEHRKFGRILQSAPMYSRKHAIEKVQQGWLGFVMKPWTEAWVKLNPDCAFLLQTLYDNIQHWNTFKEEVL